MAQVVDAERILDPAVERGGRIVERGAVLGDVDRQARVAPAHVDQRLREALGNHFPAGLHAGVIEHCDRLHPEHRIALVVLHRTDRVVVHAHEVDRLMDAREIRLESRVPGVAEQLGHLRRIPPEQRGIDVIAVVVDVVAATPVDVLGAIAGGTLGLEIEDDPDLPVAAGAERLHRRSVRTQDVVRGDHRLLEIAMAGRVHPVEVARVDHHPWLVERRPQLHPVAERVERDARELGEPVDRVTRQPAAAVVERRRQVPVVESGHRLDAALEQPVDQPRVEVEPGLVHRPGAGRQDASPGEAEPVGPQPELAHQLDVRLPAPVVIARHITGIAVLHPSGGVGEAVPDTGAGAVGERGPLDLIGGGGGAPEESRREGGVVVHGRRRIAASLVR